MDPHSARIFTCDNKRLLTGWGQSPSSSSRLCRLQGEGGPGHQLFFQPPSCQPPPAPTHQITLSIFPRCARLQERFPFIEKQLEIKARVLVQAAASSVPLGCRGVFLRFCHWTKRKSFQRSTQIGIDPLDCRRVIPFGTIDLFHLL